MDGFYAMKQVKSFESPVQVRPVQVRQSSGETCSGGGRSGEACSA